MSNNTNLNTAKMVKNDEFYTQLSDIEREISYYDNVYFKDKVVLCNCDGVSSKFWEYFHKNFKVKGLRKLIGISYALQAEGRGKVYIYEGGTTADSDMDLNICVEIELTGRGDFREEECIEYLKGANVVVTNPPFSLFREYVAQLIEYDKKFLIIGNGNAVTYKEIFPLIKENQMWVGVTRQMTGSMWFRIPDDMPYKKRQKIENGVRYQNIGNSCWFTNLDVSYRHEKIILRKSYNTTDFPQYDNYDAIEVSNVSDIPVDYNQVMGVPITFLGKYNPEQFEIVGWSRHNALDMDGGYWHEGTKNDALINGKAVYRRILIRKKVCAGYD